VEVDGWSVVLLQKAQIVSQSRATTKGRTQGASAMATYESELIKVALPYWEAEAEIASRFFSSRPAEENHIFWLKAQLWKELHPVDGYFNGIHKELSKLAEMFPNVDKDIDRHHYRFLLEQMLQEFNHYVLLADILEYLTGKKVSVEDTVQLPQERRLQEVRHRYATSGSEIDRAAVLFTEGGGARLFREGRKVEGGKLEEMIAAAMGVIYEDEKNHFREAAEEAARLIHSPEELQRMKRAVEEISRQRVAMRREMFREPMTEAEVEAFVREMKAKVEAGEFVEA